MAKSTSNGRIWAATSPDATLTSDGGLIAIGGARVLTREEALGLAADLTDAAQLLGSLEAETDAIVDRWPLPVCRVFAQRLLDRLDAIDARTVVEAPASEKEAAHGSA